MKPVLLHDGAVAELHEAAAWYERRRPGLGVQFRTAVEKAVSRIQHNPQAGAHFRTSRFRYVLVRCFPYVVFFAESEQAVRVLAIAHASARPGYWISRAGDLTTPKVVGHQMFSPREILGPAGRIAARLPNYEHRAEQLAMAEAVAAAIARPAAPGGRGGHGRGQELRLPGAGHPGDAAGREADDEPAAPAGRHLHPHHQPARAAHRARTCPCCGA